MKEKRSNSVTVFEAETICDNINVEFTRTVKENGTMFCGKIRKGDKEVGDISFDSEGDYLIIRLKPFSVLTEDETESVLSSIPQFVKEILN